MKEYALDRYEALQERFGTAGPSGVVGRSCGEAR